LDRSRRRSGHLTAIAATALGLIAAGPAAPPLKAMRWLAPGADAARILTRRRAECLGASPGPGQAYSVELGRAAFRAPLILGGQAARAGISCDSCHQNGRTNPDFDFPGLSGAPGTADVTSFLFSSHRGDDDFDPRPIPDLGGPKGRLKISQARGSRALESFIHGLVTEEFDGPEPPAAVLAGLADYVRALSLAACPVDGAAPLRVEASIGDVRRAVRAGQAAWKRGDTAAAGIMVGAARSQLGVIAERYGGPRLGPARAGLKLADLDLVAVQAALRRGDGDSGLRLTTWLARSEDWSAPLRRDERLSLYAPGVLAAATAAR